MDFLKDLCCKMAELDEFSKIWVSISYCLLSITNPLHIAKHFYLPLICLLKVKCDMFEITVYQGEVMNNP